MDTDLDFFRLSTELDLCLCKDSDLRNFSVDRDLFDFLLSSSFEDRLGDLLFPLYCLRLLDKDLSRLDFRFSIEIDLFAGDVDSYLDRFRDLLYSSEFLLSFLSIFSNLFTVLFLQPPELDLEPEDGDLLFFFSLLFFYGKIKKLTW